MSHTIFNKFASIASSAPDAPAIITENDCLSYMHLLQFADAITQRFPNARPKSVGIVMDHNAAQIAAILSVLSVGASYVPIEPSFPIERMKYMIGESGVDFIITNLKYINLLPELPKVIIESFWKKSSTGCDNASNQDGGNAEAYVLYTSGTTGHPKGVRVTNANVLNYANAFYNEFKIGPGDIMLQYSVCTFDIFVEEVFATLLNGATLAIPSLHTRENLTKLMDFVDRNKVTIISGFPYLLLELNKLDRLPSSLRLLISGGDVLRMAYITNLISKVDIYNTYGPSETTVCASYFKCTPDSVLEDGTFPIGKPVLGVDMEILDENLRPVQPGQIGEICISGRGVSLGYLGNPPEQANFLTLPDGKRLYRSGDLGYLMEDGNIAFLHRKDSQVMIQGKRVECSEVENVLSKFEEIATTAVRAFTDTAGLSHLVAYIVPKFNKLSIKKIKSKLSLNLTNFMIPEFFVKLKEMPLSANGKIDTQRLPLIKNLSLL